MYVCARLCCECVGVPVRWFVCVLAVICVFSCLVVRSIVELCVCAY